MMAVRAFDWREGGFMKVYTGTGDQGKTSLFSGERVAKSHVRIEAYGDLDELNSVMGAFAATLALDDPALVKLVTEIRRIQAWLFDAGAWLATTPDATSINRLTPFTADPSQALEKAVDRMDETLPDLKKFILPGGHMSASFAHVARSVCRRAERHATRMAEAYDMASDYGKNLHHILVFLNRLSDYLFVLARHCNWMNGVEDIIW